MRKYSLNRLAADITLKFLNFDERPRIPALKEGRMARGSDMEISLFRTSGGDTSRAKNGGWGEGAVYYFDENVLVEHAIVQSVNDAFIKFQEDLGMIFLHAASVVIGNKAFIFTAPSGGGKTTVAGLAAREGLETLTDECVAIRRDNGRFFTGRYPVDDFSARTSKVHEIAGIYFLHKSGINALEKLSVLEAVRMAMPQATYFRYYPMSNAEKKIYRAYVLDHVASMIKKARFGVLHFDRTPELFRHIRVERC